MQLYHPRRKKARRALQWPFLRLHPLNRPRYQTDTSAYNTTCDTLEDIHAPGRAQPIPDTTATPGTLYRPAQPPIIIRYIRGCRGAPLSWIHARQCSTSQTMPAAAGQLLPCADRWQVLHLAHLLRGQRLHLCRVSPAGSRCFPRPAAGGLAPGQRSARGGLAPCTRRGSPAAGARRAARNHWRLSPHLFSGFRPIANRGQQ